MRLVVDDQRAELHSRPIECVRLLDLAEEIVAHASNLCAALPVGHGVRWSRWGPVLVRRSGYERDASGVLRAVAVVPDDGHLVARAMCLDQRAERLRAGDR